MKTGLTQAQRSAATQRRLLDAAAGVLIEEGYARLTTTKVCRRAGLSQGALFKHFGSKLELVTALAEDLYAGLARDFEAAFQALEPGPELIGQSIGRLWDVFSSDRQLASYDLTLAARTDEALKALLDPIVLSQRDRIQAIADQVRRKMGLPAEVFNELADVVLLAVQGLVINGLALEEQALVQQRLAFLESLVKNRLSGLSGEKLRGFEGEQR